MSKKIFGRYTINKTKEIHFSNNEVFFDFLDDEAAEAFEFWWNTDGVEIFTQYLIKEKKEYLL